MSPIGEDDSAALARLAAGESSALRVLVERHGPSLLRYLTSLVGPSAAEDVLQETFTAAFRGAATFRGEGSVKAWLFSIARHASSRSKRRFVEEPREDADLEALGGAAGWGDECAPDVLLSGKEQLDALAAALATLDPADREVLLLRDVEGLSGEATCSMLGIGLAAMKSRLHRARLRLLASLPTHEVAP